MSNSPTCQAYRCTKSGEFSEDAKLLLCTSHSEYVSFIRSIIEAQVDAGEITEGRGKSILFSEAAKIVHPAGPQLIVLEGGKS